MSKREIKFRAWDKNNNRMQYVDGTNEWSTSIGVLLDSFEGEDLMQYTGLKDKKGKEIYEGDIVLVSDENVAEMIGGYPRWETENRIECVTFEGGSYFLGDELLAEENDYSEVIGNIYENPEFLADES